MQRFKGDNILLGQRSEFTKHPCFLCLWDSWARQEHWAQDIWPKSANFRVGKRNILHVRYMHIP